MILVNKKEILNINKFLKVLGLICYQAKLSFQIDLLKSQASARLNFEYESLIGNEKVCADDIEVIIINPGTKSAEARFFIRLEMDFSRLPQRIKHSSNDAAMLLVTFSGQDWHHVVPQLFLTKSVEELFGNKEHLQIPPFPFSNGLLIDYVPTIMKFLDDKVRVY